MCNPSGTSSAMRSSRRLSSSAALWPAAAVLLVLAGSLSPFSFDLSATGRDWGAWAIGWPPSTLPDLATNILVYVPVGLSVCIWLRRRLGLCGALAAALVVGGTVSLTAETLQTIIPVRTASWVDVGVNLAGTLVGALLGPALAACVRAAVARLRAAVAAKPMSSAAGLVAVAVLLAGLWPFDFVGDTAQLHGSLARTRWSPLAATPGDDAPAALQRSLLPAAGAAGMFAAFGFLTALAGRESGRPRQTCVEAAIAHTVILALVVETVQIFVVSRSFDTLDAILDCVGGGLGAYLAIVAVDGPSRSCWMAQPAVLLRPLLLVPVLLAQVAYRILDAAGVAGRGAAALENAAVVWLPFSAYYGRPLASVLAQAAAACCGAALLALTVAGLAHSLNARARWAIGAAAAVCVAAVCETVQAFGRGHVADVTEPILAAGGALLAAALWRQLRPGAGDESASTGARLTLSHAHTTVNPRSER